MRRIFAVVAAAGTLWVVALVAPAHADLSSDVASLEMAPESSGYPGQDALNINYDRDEILQRNFDVWPDCDGYFSRYDAVCHASDDTVDIDHRVSVKEAWDSGLRGDAAWEEFDGDGRNLNVMTDDLNQQVKSDKDIAEWTPDHALCHYVRHYVATKVAYDLSVDQAEKATLVDLAERCDPGGGQSPGNGGGNSGGGNGGGGTGEPGPAPKPEPVEGDLVVTG